ncbi:MAG: hypothetical protein ABIR60_08545 [Allosphingosinicella sp.]
MPITPVASTVASQFLDQLAEQVAAHGDAPTVGPALLEHLAGMSPIEASYLTLGVLDLLRARGHRAGVVVVLRAIRGGV